VALRKYKAAAAVAVAEKIMLLEVRQGQPLRAKEDDYTSQNSTGRPERAKKRSALFSMGIIECI
jgi:hypothetical protein